MCENPQQFTFPWLVLDWRRLIMTLPRGRRECKRHDILTPLNANYFHLMLDTNPICCYYWITPNTEQQHDPEHTGNRNRMAI